MTRGGMSAVSFALRGGVVISFVLLTVGLLLSLGNEMGPAIHPEAIGTIARGILRLDAAATIHLGLLALLATPFARVVALLVQFARERDRPFVTVSFGVLLLLITTITIGMMWKGSR